MATMVLLTSLWTIGTQEVLWWKKKKIQKLKSSTTKHSFNASIGFIAALTSPVSLQTVSCRRLRTHWSHGRTNWSTTSRPCGLTSTRSSLWIWPQRRRTPWCRCAPGRPKSSSQGRNAWSRTSGPNPQPWLRSCKRSLHVAAGYAKLQKPTGFWSRSWLMLLTPRRTPSTKCTPSSQR